MSIGELFLILTGCVFSSNYILVHYCGADTALSASTLSLKNSVLYSLYLALVLVISALIIWPLEHYLLSSSSFLRLLLYVVTILLVTALVSRAAGKKCGELFSLALSSSILGALLLFQENGYTFLETIFASLGTSAGYLLVSLALSSVREKVKDRYVPSALRGWPVMMISLGIIAMTVYAF